MLHTLSSLQPVLVIAIVLATLWLLAAGMALVLRPHSAAAENQARRMILGIVSVALGLSWIGAFGSPWAGRTEPEMTRLSAVGTATVSCASVTAGMTAATVRRLLGDPPATLPTLETRGPKTEVWPYDFCSVHMIDNIVDLIE
jgi:hypothetical protein